MSKEDKYIKIQRDIFKILLNEENPSKTLLMFLCFSSFEQRSIGSNVIKTNIDDLVRLLGYSPNYGKDKINHTVKEILKKFIKLQFLVTTKTEVKKKKEIITKLDIDKIKWKTNIEIRLNPSLFYLTKDTDQELFDSFALLSLNDETVEKIDYTSESSFFIIDKDEINKIKESNPSLSLDKIFLVYCIIKSFMNYKTRMAFCGYSKVSEVGNLSILTVSRVVHFLSDNNIIFIQFGKQSQGRKEVNKYFFK